MKHIKRKLILSTIFILLLGLMLQGCGKSISTASQENQPEVREYSKTVTDLHITPDYVPDEYFMDMTDSLCYFGQETVTEQGEEISYSCKFYFQTLDGKGEPTFILEVTERVLAFHLSKASSGEDILCILTMEEQKCVLTEYDGKGRIVKQFEITDDGFLQSYVSELLRLENGSYLAYNMSLLYVFDDKGMVLRPIECPGAGFLGAFLGEDKGVYVIYSGEGLEETFYTEVNVKTGTLSANTAIPGNGMLCYGLEGELLLVSDDSLYRFNLITGETNKVLDWVTYNVFPQKIHAIDYYQGTLRILNWDMGRGDKPVQLISIARKSEKELEMELRKLEAQEGEYDSEGKRIITLYDPYDVVGLLNTELIDCFNQENQEYTVVVKSDNPNVGAVLNTDESPDLLLELQYSMIESYQKNGYLEDLTPYMDESEILSMDRIQKSVLEGFTFDGGLYALPKYCSISTILCLESQVGERRGWTVDEYLDWIEKNPDLKSSLWMSKEALLEDCIRGNLEKYVDFESGQVKFTGDDFKRLLARINYFEIDRAGEDYFETENYNIDAPRIFDMAIYSVLQITELESQHGENVVCMGFPNDTRKTTVMLDCVTNLSILSNSTCKEGAFAFMEYCLTYGYDEWKLDIHKTYERRLWTDKNRLENECDASNIYRAFRSDYSGNILELEYEITEEQEKKVMDMLANARMETYEENKIRSIIYEEVQPYFQGQKDLDTVCDIIQSRVSILLSERR